MLCLGMGIVITHHCRESFIAEVEVGLRDSMSVNDINVLDAMRDI